MKKLLFIFALLAAAAAHAQQPSPPPFTYVTTPPSGACVGTPPIQIVYFTGAAYVCANGNWTPLGGGGGGGGGGGIPTFGPLGTATSGINYHSNIAQWQGSYWTGAAAAQDNWSISDVVTPGTNPYTLLNISHAGSSGGAEVNFANTPVNFSLGATVPLGQSIQMLNLAAGSLICTDTGSNLTTTSCPGAAFPISAVAGEAPISTGPGTIYAAQPVIQQYSASNNQFIVQPTTTSIYTTLGVTNLNNVFYVDGYANGNYAGIGQAQVAWATGPNYPMCQAVSYSSANYMAINPVNGTVTPGTNAAIWAAVPNAQASTLFDCAYWQAAEFAIDENVQATVVMGASKYFTNGIVLPSNLYSVNVKGCGVFCSYLQYTGSRAIPVINKLNGSNYPQVQLIDFLIDAGQVASADMQLYGMGISVLRNIEAINPAPGSDHFIELGDGVNISFDVQIDNVSTNPVAAGYGEPSGGYPQITANIVGGGITSYTIVNGGSGQPQNGLTVEWLGNKNGTSNTPCTTLPTQPTLTYNGSGVLTAMTPAGATPYGVGCVGTVDVQIHSLYPVNYGLVMNTSDSTIKDFYCFGVAKACIQNNWGNNTYIHAHPQTSPIGIQNFGSNSTFDATELDAIYNYGFDFETDSGQNLAATLIGTQAYTGGRLLPGSSPFYFGVGATNVVFSAMNSLYTPGYVPVDWHEFMTQSGPTDLGAAFPAGVSVLGNDPLSSSAQGDYDPLLTVGNLNVTGTFNPSGTINLGALNINPLGTATVGGNFASNNLLLADSYWNGSAAAKTYFGFTVSPGSGSNPFTSASIGFQGGCPSGGCEMIVQPKAYFEGLIQATVGIATTVYTVSTLPSAATSGAGTQLTVSDASSFTPGTCTGGGSDYMIAISNGTTWSCH